MKLEEVLKEFLLEDDKIVESNSRVETIFTIFDKNLDDRLRITIEFCNFQRRKFVRTNITQSLYEEENNCERFLIDELVPIISDWIENHSKYRLLILLNDLNHEIKTHKKTIYKNYLDNVDIYKLEFSVRSYNCLTRDGFHRIGDLRKLTEEHLNSMAGIGERSRGEIREKMKDLEISFAKTS